VRSIGTNMAHPPHSPADPASPSDRPPDDRVGRAGRVGVTIGLPFLDSERTLVAALRSVFAQTWHDWELILVDDGSRDRSREIAARVQDPRVRLVADGHNRGLVARLNQIARLARCPYVCRMDGDDLSHPERLAAQVAYLEAHPEVDVLDTMAFSMDAEGRPWGVRAGLPAVHDARAVLLARGGALIHASVMARVEWVRRFPYDPAFVRAEDQELWVRTCASSRLAHLPRPLYFIREDGSVSLANYRRSCATSRAIVRRYGPPLIGRLGTEALVARYRAKELAYRVFAALGQTGRLVARRSAPLAPAQLAEARQAIAAVLRTPVPGLEHEVAA